LNLEEIKDIIKYYLEPYVSGYNLENLVLDEVLHAYDLKGLIHVEIGSMNNELIYVVREPEFSSKEYEAILEEVVENIISRKSVGKGIQLYFDNILDRKTYLYFKVMSGLGPFTPLVIDPDIEDIYIAGKTGRVYVVHNKFSGIGWLRTNIMIQPSFVDKLVVSISRRIGKHISLVNPLAEGTYGGDLRVSLTYGEMVSPHGSSLVIRKRSGVTWTITKLINERSISSIIASYLWLIIERKGWIIIAGHVGSGKTTLLQALLTLIPSYKKIITIEDTPEISGTTGLWEPLVEKTEVFTRESQIDSYTLLKFALRRRPDYIVIGEVRGIEAKLLVQASRLGHGVLNTMHADSPESVLKRLMAPPISIPKNLLNNIWSIVMVGINSSGKRSVLALSEINDDSELIELCYNTNGSCDVEKLVESTNRLSKYYSRSELYSEITRRALFLERLVSQGAFSLSELVDKITGYYISREQAERIDIKETRQIAGVLSGDSKVPR
jgi:Type IV secretory pathway, VirB11 components, and related ATPases involved in archaeal flagella biosynthesis